MTTEMHQFLTTTEAAAILRLSQSRVCQLCADGELPARRTCGSRGQWRIDREKLLQLINAPTKPKDDPVPAPDEELDFGLFERLKKKTRAMLKEQGAS